MIFQVGWGFVPIFLYIHSANRNFLGGISFCESSIFEPNVVFVPHLINLLGPSACMRARHDGKQVWSRGCCHELRSVYIFFRKTSLKSPFPLSKRCKVSNNTFFFVKIELILIAQCDILEMSGHVKLLNIGMSACIGSKLLLSTSTENPFMAMSSLRPLFAAVSCLRNGHRTHHKHAHLLEYVKLQLFYFF